jgi:gentisate 1,2-dioxygenase
VVDNSVIDNPGYSDRIWPLGEPKIITDGELISENRGWTYIRGQTYKVSDNDLQLIPTTGSQRYDIAGVESHKYEEKHAIAVRVPAPGDNPTTWQYQFLGDKSLSSGNLVCVDDI